MYRFTNDYSEGAHPSVLNALTETNLEGNFGYGRDPHCAHAADLIREKIARPDADVHFFVGGTQTNATCICAFLRPENICSSGRPVQRIFNVTHNCDLNSL